MYRSMGQYVTDNILNNRNTYLYSPHLSQLPMFNYESYTTCIETSKLNLYLQDILE